jgi:hypothetical protein
MAGSFWGLEEDICHLGICAGIAVGQHGLGDHHRGPTTGFGCNSGSYILYGIVSTMILVVLSLSSYLVHHPKVRYDDDIVPHSGSKSAGLAEGLASAVDIGCGLQYTLYHPDVCIPALQLLQHALP